jgi:hypothetical protein
MIDGTATFTIVASTMIIETPRLIATSPHHRRRPDISTVMKLFLSTNRR